MKKTKRTKAEEILGKKDAVFEIALAIVEAVEKQLTKKTPAEVLSGMGVAGGIIAADIAVMTDIPYYKVAGVLRRRLEHGFVTGEKVFGSMTHDDRA